jgi:hypothetical protein
LTKAFVPASLRDAWAGEVLPAWLCDAVKVPRGTTLDALGPSAQVRGPESSRLLNYIASLLRARRTGLARVGVLRSGWPRGVDPVALQLSTRTRNALTQAGLLSNVGSLGRLTFGGLLSVPGLGVRSSLDFALSVEEASVLDPIDIDPDLIVAAIESPWAEFISGEDPRFADLLEPQDGTLIDQLDAFTSSGARIADEPWLLAIAEKLPEILSRVQAIEAMPLDAAVRQVIGASSGAGGARLDALLGRLGCAEVPPITLQEGADRIGVTRERFRQLQAKLVERLPSHVLYMPALDRALSAVAEEAPLQAEAAANLLKRKGLASIALHPRGLLELADFFGRQPTFQIESVGGRERVVSEKPQAASNKLLGVASRRATAVGTTNVADVALALAEDGLDIGEDEVRDLLKHYSSAQFLEGDWFWFPGRPRERNRLYNVARSILSVAAPLDIATIREGVRRKYRFRSLPLVPPRSVMLAFFRAHDGFKVNDQDRVELATPTDYRDVLGAAEQTMVEVLRASPTGLLDRESFARACEGRGLNLNTFSVFTTYSPILEHVGQSIWGLRGVRVDPAALDALREVLALKPRERRVIDHGWTSEGRLWIAVRLPGAWSSRIFMLPSSIAPYVAGRHFPAKARSGAESGTIGVNEAGNCWGFASFLSRSGADEGDVLVVTFDLTKETAILDLLGDEEPLESLVGL